MTAWLVSRFAAEYVLRRLKLTSGVFGSDLVAALVSASVSQASIGHIARDPELSRLWGGSEPVIPRELRRPISAYAVAAALGLPRETVRRKIRTLVASGYMEEEPDGVVVRADRASDPAFMEAMRDMARLTSAFCADLGEAGYAAAYAQPGEVPTQPRLRVVALNTTAFMLRFFEDLNAVAEDQLTGLSYLAIAAANTRHLDWRADVSPFRGGMAPIGLRKPVTALALATELGVPRETARRQVRKLTDMGHARLVTGGVVIDPSRLPRPEADNFVGRTEANVRRLLTTLRDTGVLPPPP